MPMTPLSANRSLEKPARYHPVLVGLHWFLAIFIVAALALGIFALKTTPNSSPMKYEALRAHMTGGLAILLLMLIRFGIRIFSAHPAAAEAGSNALNGIAKISHFALYGAVFAMVAAGLTTAIQAGILPILTGSVTVPLPETFNIFPARVLHGWVAKGLIALITVHVGAAFYHQLVRRDGLWSRMWFGRRWRQYTKSQTPKRLEPEVQVQRFLNLSPWLGRLLLLAAAALFTMISLRYLGDPVGRAAADGINLASVMAISRLRIGFGAFPLAFALLFAASIVIPRRTFAGLIALAMTLGVVTIVRLLGILVDGSAEEALKLLRVETILFVVSIACIFLERTRRRRASAISQNLQQSPKGMSA